MRTLPSKTTAAAEDKSTRTTTAAPNTKLRRRRLENLLTMLRLASTSSSRLLRNRCIAQFGNKNLSSKAGPLEADAGSWATHTHHSMMVVLAVATPVYFLVPDQYSDGPLNKLFGIGLAFYISAHSWIGLNYVCTDYVPKISKSLLGPSRFVSELRSLVWFE